ncbi:putative membrane protein [Peribacillus deserti]|uniref:Membrane protein n=1 Tax=Peribacillus deserti TaxID=673318 RepID=A0ABS2QQL9_9BACI|nr:hypothetical protein [Peribacillus deserti]MBM7694748.1 putative membrane protein [Peribacillus deserti]
MRRNLGIISIIVMVFGIMSVWLTKYSDFFADYYLQIIPISIVIALILALLSEKGIWRRIAFRN